jgi:cell wall assembly regulator SMI1
MIVGMGRVMARCPFSPGGVMTRRVRPLWAVGLFALSLWGCTRPEASQREGAWKCFKERPSDVASLWRRFESWLGVHSPRILAGLAPPATPERLAAAERTVGFALPADLRASLLIHDGEATDVGSIAGLTLNSLEAIQRDWRVMKEVLEVGWFDTPPFPGPAHEAWVRDIEARERGEKPKRPRTPPVPASDPRLRDGHWHVGWIAIASVGDGDSVSLDLDPAPGGTVGQNFYFDHEADGGPARLYARSFSEWLECYVEDLEAGRVEVASDGYLRYPGYRVPWE